MPTHTSTGREQLARALVLATGCAVLALGHGGRHAPTGPSRAQQVLGRLPITFEPNRGQAPAGIRFLARLGLQRVGITDDGLVWGPGRRGATPARLVFQGAAPTSLKAASPLPGRTHYLLGNEPGTWRTDIPTFSRVVQRQLYPGIGIAYYGRGNSLEYDLIVHPGADPGQIKLRAEGFDSVQVDASGSLIARVGSAVVTQAPPQTYEEGPAGPLPVETRYVLRDGIIALQLGARDVRRTLIIDPQLSYSSFLGGAAADVLRSVAVDAVGNIYAIGFSSSVDFPMDHSVQSTNGGGEDIVVLKLDASTHALVYSTFIGGAGNDEGYGLAVDGAGNVFCAGQSNSSNFPTVSPLQGALKGGFDAVLFALNPSGSALTFATYLGGSADDGLHALRMDGKGALYAVGSTSSSDFPVFNAAQPTYGGGTADALILKLGTVPPALAFATYLGGTADEGAYGVATDGSGALYAVGETHSTNFPTTPGAYRTTPVGALDTFVTKLGSTGALAYSTYFGGSGDDHGRGIAADTAGNAYVSGQTTSTDLPTPNAAQPSYGGGFQDIFVFELNSTATALAYSTYVGGNGDENGESLVLDPSGAIYVAGMTASNTFPLVGAVQPVPTGGFVDAAIAGISAAGTAIIFGTHLGGSGGSDYAYGVAEDDSGALYVVGSTASPDFPTVLPTQGTFAGATDGFISKILMTSESALSSSPATGPATGGTRVTILGRNFTPGLTFNFGGSNVPVSVTSTTQLTVKSPPHRPGPVDLVLTWPDQTQVTLPNAFTYQPVSYGVGCTCGSGSDRPDLWGIALLALCLARHRLRRRSNTSGTRALRVHLG